jgi:hypothetical protein
MADFTARPTSGTVVTDWHDYPGSGRPSRLNPAGQPHRYYKAVVGALIVLQATAEGGAEGAADGTLGGRLYLSWVGERPNAAAFTLTNPVGFSSIVNFTPLQVGHWMIVFRRPSGGAVGIHIDVEAS